MFAHLLSSFAKRSNILFLLLSKKIPRTTRSFTVKVNLFLSYIPLRLQNLRTIISNFLDQSKNSHLCLFFPHPSLYILFFSFIHPGYVASTLSAYASAVRVYEDDTVVSPPVKPELLAPEAIPSRYANVSHNRITRSFLCTRLARNTLPTYYMYILSPQCSLL